MPKVNFVKKARKNYKEAGIKKGESYYWWKFRFGGKYMQKTAPRRSQLTQSDFLSAIYDIEDRISEISTLEEAQTERDEIVSELRDLASEQEDKLSNMPENLQSSPTAELLQNRADECNSFADELESVDLDIEEDEDIKDEEERRDNFNERADDAISELQNCSYNGE